MPYFLLDGPWLPIMPDSLFIFLPAISNSITLVIQIVMSLRIFKNYKHGINLLESTNIFFKVERWEKIK